jgi:hypothetical protein
VSLYSATISAQVILMVKRPHMGSVYRAFVAINHRPETSRHSRSLAILRVIAELARDSGTAARAGVRMIAPRLIRVRLTDPSGITTHAARCRLKPFGSGVARGHDGQSSSSSRRTAAAAGFLVLSHWGDRPERYGEPSFFDTMPSQPSAQACLKMTRPSPS